MPDLRRACLGWLVNPQKEKNYSAANDRVEKRGWIESNRKQRSDITGGSNF